MTIIDASTNHDHQEILQQSIHLYENDKLLAASRLLQSIDSFHYEPIHHHIVQEGRVFEQLFDQRNETHQEWIQQGEQHGRYNFCMYYKLSKENHLTCRMETPIHPDLLVPLLSVLVRRRLCFVCIRSSLVSTVCAKKTNILCIYGVE